MHADEGRARRRQRHGRPDGRARCSTSCRIEQVQTYWTPGRQVPRPRAEPAAAREPRASSSRRSSSEGAELGIAWDGDADRCFFIDDTGQFVDGDFLTALLAESILEKEPGAKILYDVRA